MLLCCVPAFAQGTMMMPAPTQSNYWLVSGRFVGAKQCALCHAAESRNFHHNSMSRALEPMETCAILKGNINYTWKDAKYSYRITRVGDKILYRVTDGKETQEVPLQYAFGQGKAGQTYVFEIAGEFYESRVSYYEKLKGLDLTVGAMNREPTSVRTAAGRRIDRDETRDCFGCHTTGARTGATFQLTNFQAGVQCESCHGPGGAHLDSIRNGRPAPNSIRSLKGMDPEETNEMCGVCHRTWEAVMTAGLSGLNTVRFPPYRLSISKCFSLQDRRIACTACHNPHEGLVEDDKDYDAKCTACHNQANTSISKRTCPTGKQGCTSCHMPRIEPPESHHAFPDHWIRVVRSKGEYPE
jgi:Cytochrome c554 and c-prime